MALIYMDGFDKYGGLNSNITSVAALLLQEWTSAAGTNNATLVAPLSATGQAISIALPAVTQSFLAKTLASNYGRLIGGVRFSSNLGASKSLVAFRDVSTNQCTIVQNSTGTISLFTGASNGTLIATSTASVTANSTHYLEWDITFSATGAYQIWLDGVSILSGTGNTKTTANNYSNSFVIGETSNSSAGTAACIYDDIYLFDTTTSQNNAVLLTSPRIETQFPTSDGTVQFAVGASTLGNNVSRNSTNYSTVANTLYLRPYTPSRACTFNSIGLLAGATSATINLRPVIYADNGGTPNGGALLSAGSTVTGITSGALVTLPLTTPQSLTAGTQYWVGFMNDIAVSNGIAGADALATGRSATSTFASGAPGTCPAMTTGIATAVAFGNITLTTPANFYEHSNPVQGTSSYVYDATVGDEDLYNFPNLSVAPTAIYAVAVKGNVAKSDAGAKTVSLHTLSAGTDSGGSLTGQAPGTSFTWLTSLFPTDPATSAAWTQTGLNAAQSGFRVDS